MICGTTRYCLCEICLLAHTIIESSNLCSIVMNHCSVVNINLFAVLGDDGEQQQAPSLSTVAPEVVRKTTSSKKSDNPPPKADPNRANPNRAKAQGNEAAFRDKNAGRDSNRSKAAPENTKGARRGRDKDRRSQTGRNDTSKKVTKGWGDNRKQAQEEASAESIAKADEKADASEDAEAAEVVEEPDNTKTLEEYMEELRAKTAALNVRHERKPNEGADDSKWQNAAELVKEEVAFVPATKTKTVRSKTKKEKQILEADLSFEAPQQSRGDRGDRRGPRRGGNDRRGGRGGNNARSGKPAGGRRPAPVNVTNPDEFPTLGA
uniref:ARAD1C01738p n=1 Tax=Blastobotrys adeninivorans TaxID=409370 RepID=A0A060SZM1_BLAAD